MIAVFINIVYLVLSILVFIGYKSHRRPEIMIELQRFHDVFAVYSIIYEACSIGCCAVGIQVCRKFRRVHSHTSFLEYLLLFATSGVLFQSLKRIVAFATNSSSDSISAYYILEFLDMVLALLQIVLYYWAKDVKVQLTSADGHADSLFKVTVFKNIMVVIAITNFATWISDSFLLPEMSTSITPSSYFIEQWPVYDNVVTPITIFFRFNSALLFWCIRTDVLQSGELHQD